MLISKRLQKFIIQKNIEWNCKVTHKWAIQRHNFTIVRAMVIKNFTCIDMSTPKWNARTEYNLNY